MIDELYDFTSMTTFLLLVSLGLLVSQPVCQVASSGLGEQIMRSDDTSVDINPLFVDSLFGGPDVEDSPEILKFKEAISKVHIDVVRPNKELRDVMNTISTRAQYLILSNSWHYSKASNIDTTSRPMLLTFIKIDILSKEKLLEWYGPINERKKEKVVDSCNTMIIERRNHVRSAGDIDDAIVNCQMSIGRYRCVYLVALHNQLLFMMDLYLRLCSKLEGERLVGQLDFKLTT